MLLLEIRDVHVCMLETENTEHDFLNWRYNASTLQTLINELYDIDIVQ